MKQWQKYSLLCGFCFASSSWLAGCATNTAPSANIDKDASATTYGLVSNVAPENIPGPDISTQTFVAPSANVLTAPANLMMFVDAKDTLNDHDQQALQNQANYLVIHPEAVVQLNGYSNADGSPNVNVLLSWQMLQKIKQQLMQYGVAPKQIEMVSYGKEMPMVDGFGKDALQYNRRVQLVYKDKTS